MLAIVAAEADVPPAGAVVDGVSGAVDGDVLNVLEDKELEEHAPARATNAALTAASRATRALDGEVNIAGEDIGSLG
jgi:hypothetical protein